VIPDPTRPQARAEGSWTLYSSELSPFGLKLDLMLDFAGVPHHWCPAQASFLEALRVERRVRQIRSGRRALTWPERNEWQEFPAVPFLLGPEGQDLFDSSAIGEWLDQQGSPARAGTTALLPGDDPALRLAIRLVDEYLDEFGLYLVHHNRWVVSARDNDAGARLAREFASLLGPLAAVLGPGFSRRQVRRLPYLFSVAPPDAAFEDLPRGLRPPQREGFPPTHALLEERFAALLAALETRLAESPFLFGPRLTLADASVYGQLAMNLSDPSAEAWIARDAPTLRAWLDRLSRADFSGHDPSGPLELAPGLQPLFAEVAEVFVPLMQQNLAAYERVRDTPGARFNEAGFDAGLALYDGRLGGHAYRSVAKRFQAGVWRSLREAFDALTPAEQERLARLLPIETTGLDRDF